MSFKTRDLNGSRPGVDGTSYRATKPADRIIERSFIPAVILVLLALPILAGEGVAQQSGAATSAVTIENLELAQSDDKAILRASARGPLVYTHYRGEDGDFVLELVNAIPGSGITDSARDDGLIEWVHVRPERLGGGGQPLTRIVVHTKAPSETTLQATDGVVSISFQRIDSLAGAGTTLR